MAKQNALGCAFYLDGNDIGGDTQSFTVHGGPATLDSTDITQSAMSRLGGQYSAELSWVSFFDPAAGASHAVLSPQPNTDRIGTILIPPIAIGCPSLGQIGKQVNYDGTRAQSGEFTYNLNEQSNGFSQEWGVSLTAGKRTDGGATAGSPFDNLAGFTFGAQGYLQVFAFSGTDVTVKIQSATTSGGAYTDRITFTQITGGAPLAQRVATAPGVTIDEFLKVTTVTTGGFSNLQFQCTVVVNKTAVNL